MIIPSPPHNLIFFPNRFDKLRNLIHPWIKELADYNPARGEFGVEYDNLAEVDVLENLGDIAQLVNNQTEQLTSELALAILDSYSRRLKKRAQIKRLVRSYSLISKRRAFSHTLRYKNIKCSSWSWNELSVFCQLISPFAMDYLMEVQPDQINMAGLFWYLVKVTCLV